MGSGYSRGRRRTHADSQTNITKVTPTRRQSKNTRRTRTSTTSSHETKSKRQATPRRKSSVKKAVSPSPSSTEESEQSSRKRRMKKKPVEATQTELSETERQPRRKMKGGEDLTQDDCTHEDPTTTTTTTTVSRAVSEVQNRTECDENIQTFVKALLSRGVGGLREEYAEKCKEIQADLVPKKDCKNFFANPSKNRYKDVLCGDLNRVILRERKFYNYIHANIVGTPLNLKRFICAQGPLPTTVNDFLLMIWQERCEFIVMLCNFIENGKVKCLEYFPLTQGAEKRYDEYVITCKEARQIFLPAAVTYRVLQIKRTGEPARIIKHYQWGTWPDRGVPPSDDSLLFLLSKFGVTSSSLPILVHCSAGIGRTGSFVLIQMSIDILENGGNLDNGCGNIFLQLRKIRLGAVQTEKQYLFVHRLLLHYFLPEGMIDSQVVQQLAMEYDRVVAT